MKAHPQGSEEREEFFYSGLQFAETKGEMSVLATEKFKCSYRGKFVLRDLSCLWPQRSSEEKEQRGRAGSGREGGTGQLCRNSQQRALPEDPKEAG